MNIQVTVRYGMAINRHYKGFTANRTAFMTTFLSDLEKPYKSFLRAQLDDVVMQNEAIYGAPCFYVGDTVYARGLTIAQIGKYKLGGMAGLDHTLQEPFQEFLAHYAEHIAHWQRFSQTLRVILMAAKDWQDLRDMLPDHALQPYLSGWGFTDLTRTRGSLQDDLPQQGADSINWEAPTWEQRLVLLYGSIQERLAVYVGYRLL